MIEFESDVVPHVGLILDVGSVLALQDVQASALREICPAVDRHAQGQRTGLCALDMVAYAVKVGQRLIHRSQLGKLLAEQLFDQQVLCFEQDHLDRRAAAWWWMR